MADSGQAEPDTVDEAATGGAALREAREARGIPIEDIATDLRIELRLIEALESERYDELGAPVFAKGYIRQYATRLGLDAEDLVAGYNEAIGFSDVRIQPSRAIRLRDGQQITAWIVALLALALVVVSLLVWWFSGPAPVARPAALADPGSVPFPDAAAGDVTATLPDPAPIEAEAPIEAPAQDVPATADGATVPIAVDAPVPDAAADGDTAVTAAESGDGVSGPAPAAEARDGVSGPARAAEARDGVPLPAPAAGPAVELVFVEDCWVEVTDANGERLLYGLIEGGTRRVISGVPPIDVFLGNADAAVITVDGSEFTVPRASRRGNLARFAIRAGTN